MRAQFGYKRWIYGSQEEGRTKNKSLLSLELSRLPSYIIPSDVALSYMTANEKSINVPAITRFVREILGCNCPDEVFRRVELQHGSTAVKSCPADYEIQVGGRLMIVLTSEPAERLTPSLLAQVIAEGQRARDAGGFNRFRLVVKAEHPDQVQDKLVRAFAAIPTRDEKTHLHVVDKHAMPDLACSAKT